MKLTYFVVPLVAVAAAVFGTTRLMESIGPKTGSSATAGASTSTNGGGGGSGGGGGGGGGGAAGSMLQPPGLRVLLARIDREGGADGNVQLFRLQAKGAQVQLSKPGGQTELLVFGPGAEVTTRVSVHTGTYPLRGFRPSEVDPKAPRRIGEAIKRLKGASLSDVDYMVYSVGLVDPQGEWNAFLADSAHTHLHADSHGRNVTIP